MAELMHNVILEKLARFIAGRADPSRQISTPVFPLSIPVLGPAEGNQVEPKRGSDRGIIFAPGAIDRRKPIEREPRRHRGILIGKSHAAPMDRRSRGFAPGW